MKITKQTMVLAAGLFAMALTGCSGSSTEKTPDYIAVQTEKDGRWGFWNPDKGIILADEFKSEPSVVFEGLFSVQNEEKDTYTLYAVGDKAPVAVKDCEELYSVGYCSEGLIPVTKAKSRITVIHKDGSEAFTLNPVKGKEITATDNGFECGMLTISTEDDMYGYVDTKGNVVIEPKYNYAGTFKYNCAFVGTRSEDKDGGETMSYKVIDKKGETIIDLKNGWNPEKIGKGGVLIKYDEDRYGIVDKKGEMQKLPNKVEDVSEFNEDYIIFRQDSEWGVMNREFETLIRPKYERVQILPGDKFLCIREDKVEVLDKDATVKATINDFESGAGYLPNFGILARDKHIYQVFNLDGEQIKGAEFYDVSGRSAQSYQVRSDYFNTEALAKSVAEQFALNGIGKFTYGTGVATVVGGNAESQYTYKSYADVDDIFKGFRYSADMRYGFTQTLANSEFDSDYNWVYTWNSEAKLSAGMLTISLGTDVNKDIMTAIVKALTGKGFKNLDKELVTEGGSKENPKFITRLENGNVIIAVYNSSSSRIEVLAVDKTTDPVDAEFINDRLMSQFTSSEN